MLFRTAVRTAALAAVVAMTAPVMTVVMPVAAAHAFDQTKYPDLGGNGAVRNRDFRFDQSKPWGPGQEAR